MKVISFALFFAVSLSARGEGLNCFRPANSYPDFTKLPGTPNAKIPIEHIVVIMQENHSFDNYFGKLNQPKFYGAQVDGLLDTHSNPGADGKPVLSHHEDELCTLDPKHDWNTEHNDWNRGRNDNFVKLNGPWVIGHYDQNDLPFYYGLANEFAVADRYFCSALTQTIPNRMYLLTGTSFGHVRNDIPKSSASFSQRTIFDTLNKYGISWKYYTDSAGYMWLFGPLYWHNLHRMAKLGDFASDLANAKLPQVVFLDSSFNGEDEHPNGNVQVGQAWVAQRVQDLVHSRYWPTSALFLTYDENGGFYDHVSPPPACVPDAHLPMLKKGDVKAAFDRYGFRVPFVAISPYAKHHYVSHLNYDHTSILKFIETKFNLPALTRRDANANDLTDMFDFAHPQFNVDAWSAPAADSKRACRMPLQNSGITNAVNAR